MSVTILYAPLTLLHRTEELVAHKLRPSFESPERIQRILAALSSAGFPVTEVNLDTNNLPQIPSSIHSEEYIKHLSEIFDELVQQELADPEGYILPECFPHIHFGATDAHSGAHRPPLDPLARLGYYSFDLSTGINKSTFLSAMAAVNTGLQGVNSILSSPGARVFCLVRPPSHHACHAVAGGYCYVNATAVVVEHLISKVPGARVGILDLDFHHGNGTQSIFYHRRNPVYVSIHAQDQYPYFSGFPTEKGDGDGEGFNVNFTLPLSANGQEYMDKLAEALKLLKDAYIADYLVVSLGFDTYYQDPIGQFQLHEEDYESIGRKLGEFNKPILVMMEGGYHEVLGSLVVNFIRGFQASYSQ